MLALGLLLVLSPAVWAQSCSTSSCTRACREYDLVLTNCNWDYRPADNYVSCICSRFGGQQGNLAALNQCVACDQDGLAAKSLSTYQVHEFLCNVYAEEGERAALSVNSASPASEIVAAFSTSNLGAIQTALCGANPITSSGELPVPTSTATRVASTTSPATGSAVTTSSSAGAAYMFVPPVVVPGVAYYGAAIVAAFI